MSSILFLIALLVGWGLLQLRKALARRARRKAVAADLEYGRQWVEEEAALWGAERFEVSYSSGSTDVVVHLFGPELRLSVSVRAMPTRARGMREAARLLARQRTGVSGHGTGRAHGAGQGEGPVPGPAPRRVRQAWRDTLGVGDDAAFPEVLAKFRDLAMLHHPDRGGSPEAMARVNAAMDEARRHLAH